MSEKIHILYVDDDPDHLTVGKRFLERYEDFTVTPISGATQALELLKSESFDVIISDYQMTHMDGNIFLKHLRDSGNNTPFILFTGRGREEVVIEALNNGVDFYLQKGGDVKVQFDELTNNILHILSKRRYETEIARKNEELQTAYEKLSSSEEELRINLEKLTIQEQKTRESEELLRVLSDNLPNGMMYQIVIEPDGTRRFAYVSKGVEKFHKISVSDVLENPQVLYNQIFEEDKTRLMEEEEKAWKTMSPFTSEVRYRTPEGQLRWALLRSEPRKLPDDSTIWDGFEIDITELKSAQEALEKRLFTLTQPLDTSGITFEDLFNIQEIQQIQDEFANATGVASIITYPDGTPITKPSNFTRLCSDIIRKTEKGCANCFKSDAIIGRPNPDGPIVQPCLSGGLWDAGASIIIGDQHIANWLIGQVRNEIQSEETIRSYANQIGADEQSAIEAFREVPSMSLEKFQDIAKTLFSFANQLSRSAYQNIQQARYITEQKESKNEIQKKNDELQAAYEQISASEEELRSNFNRLQKQEQIIKIHEDRLLMAQDIGRTGCWEYNIRENTIWGSAQGLHIFGFPKVAGDFPIDQIEDCILEKEKVHQALVDLLTKGEEYDLEYLINPADGGKQKWIHSIARIEKDSQENPVRVIGVIQDITEKKLADIALRNSEQKYRDIFENSLIGIFKTTLDGGIIEANRALASMYGYNDVQELINSKVTSAQLYASQEDRRELLQRVVDERTVENYETLNVNRKGEEFWVSITVRSIRDTDNGILFFEGSLVNINDRKRAEEALRISEHHLRTLVQAIPDPVWLKDKNGVYLSCNKIFERLINAPAESIIGKTDYDFFQKDIADFFHDRDLKAITAGKPVINEESVTFRDDGHLAFLETIKTPIFDDNGGLIGVLGIGRDITERKKTELLLKETNEALNQAQKIGKIGSWIYDIKLDQITWSDELFRVFGHEPGSLLLKLDIIRTTFHPEDLKKHDRILSTAISTHYYEPAEYRLIYPDGSLHYVNADGMVEVDASGNTIRLIGVCQDITEQKQAKEEILKKNFELQAAYEEIAASEEELRANLEEILRQEDLIRESKERFQSLFDNMVEGAALHELILTNEGVAEDYRVIEVNPAFEKNIGLSRDSVIGKTSKDAYGVTDPPYLEIYTQVAMTGEPVSFETYYPPMKKYFAISVYRPYKRSFATVFEDITIRKNSEIALLETTAYLENLIHNANVPIIVWDPSFRITRLNHAFELMIGRSADEVMGTSLELLFSPEQAERSIQLLRTTMTGGRWDTTEIDIVHKDGTIRHLLWNSSTIYTPDGKTPVATIAQGQDITRERNLEREKDAALTQVMQNLAYLSILNDEIRNPLTIISSCADLIDDALLNERILDQTQRIDTMVTQLDKRWIESEKILSYLRKHHQIHLTPSSDTKNQ